MSPSSRSVIRWTCLGAAAALLGAVACGAQSAPAPKKGPRRPPYKPGDSYAKAKQCTCNVCEPERCCTELNAEPEQIDPDCAQGYDFSQCEMAVSSCESNCYAHKWWTTVDIGCEASRPDRCCHAEAAF